MARLKSTHGRTKDEYYNWHVGENVEIKRRNQKSSIRKFQKAYQQNRNRSQ